MMNIYRLGNSFMEIASVGQDDMLQLGVDESFHKITSEQEVTSRDQFESISYRYYTDLQHEIDT